MAASKFMLIVNFHRFFN